MSERLKELAGRKAVEQVRDGMVVGLGSGSTAEYAIRALGERRAAEGMEIRCVPTSEASGRLGGEVGLQVTSLEEAPAIDLTIDGADEVDPDLNLVKGLGGALLREKIVAAASSLEIIIVDPSKTGRQARHQEPSPGGGPPLRPGPGPHQADGIRHLGGDANHPDGGEYLTDNGNFILDCAFDDGIQDPGALEARINRIPGVVENGLFVGLADLVIVAQEDGTCRELKS